MTPAQLAKCKLALPGLRWSLTSDGCVGVRGLHRVMLWRIDAPPRPIWVCEWLRIYPTEGSVTYRWQRWHAASALHAVGREMRREAEKLAALSGYTVCL